MATGGLMDLGIYCVYPAVMLFGMPDKVSAHARFLSTGADGSGCVTLHYADKTVVLTYSKTAQGEIGSEIQGEHGVIRIPMCIRDRSFCNRSKRNQKRAASHG